MKRLAIICTTAISLVACGGSAHIQSRLATADEALSNGDYTIARDICDRLITDTASMTADEIGRLAICYMNIADKSDEQTMVATAVDCYTRAYERNAEAASAFFHSQPVENDRYIMIMSTIARASDVNTSDLTGLDTIAVGDTLKSRHAI